MNLGQKKTGFIGEHIAIKYISIYLLFVLSIIVSILYTEYTIFHTVVFNEYVWGKVFSGALKNTLLALFAAHTFWFIFTRLHLLDKEKHEPSILETDIFAKIMIVILYSVTLLPLRTIIPTSYVGPDGIVLELFFIHIDTNTKIVLSVILITGFIIFLFKKYKPTFTNTIILFLLLALPPAYNIITTQYKSFEATQAKLATIQNVAQYDFNDTSIREEAGKKMEPLAQRLLNTATTQYEKGAANAWMSETQTLLGDFNKALEYNNIAIKEYESAFAYKIRSSIYRKMKDFKNALPAAENCLKIAIKKSNIDMESRCEGELSLVYHFWGIEKDFIDENDFIQAKKHIERAIALEPEPLFYEIGLVDIEISHNRYYLKKGKYVQALEQLNTLIAENNQHDDGYVLSREYENRAIVKSHMSDHVGAEADWAKSIEIYPDDTKSTYNNMGNEYARINETKKSIMAYEKALLSDPNDVHTPKSKSITDYLAVMYQNAGDYTALELLYTRMIDHNPNEAQTYADRAYFVYSNKKQYDKALVDYEKSLTLDPNNQFNRLMKASTEFYLNKIGDMCTDIKKVDVSQIPDFEFSYESLIKECKQ